jgi:UDP-N-acetylglucosamine:LPS N-acetylglucosamine transferase
LRLLVAFVKGFAIVLRTRPAVVVMVGGYAGLACSLAAIVLRVPIVVVNVDAGAGRANRLVGHFAKVSAVGATASGLPRAVVTGAPVRIEVLEAKRSGTSAVQARDNLDIPTGARVVAVVGGSLGADTLNAAALYLRRELSDLDDVFIYHVCGERNEASLRSELAREPVEGADRRYRLVAYERRLPELFAISAVVIARAGAMTVSELAVIGTASILIPLPGAPGDHQSLNARALESAGAAILVVDAEANGERVESILRELLADPSRLETMGERARSVARPDAAGAIAALVLNVIDERPLPHSTDVAPGER